jgi:hypothetical protein
MATLVRGLGRGAQKGVVTRGRARLGKKITFQEIENESKKIVLRW